MEQTDVAHTYVVDFPLPAEFASFWLTVEPPLTYHGCFVLSLRQRLPAPYPLPSLLLLSRAWKSVKVYFHSAFPIGNGNHSENALNTDFHPLQLVLTLVFTLTPLPNSHGISSVLLLTVRVVLSQHLSDHPGALSVCSLRVEVEPVHRIQDASVYGLEPIANVRQRSTLTRRHNDAAQHQQLGSPWQRYHRRFSPADALLNSMEGSGSSPHGPRVGDSHPQLQRFKGRDGFLPATISW